MVNHSKYTARINDNLTVIPFKPDTKLTESIIITIDKNFSIILTIQTEQLYLYAIVIHRNGPINIYENSCDKS